MNVGELIKWLQTMPQDAKVMTLEHHTGSGYYDQGGNTYVVPFDNKVEYQQWKDEGDTTPVEYVYGEGFELYFSGGEYILQIGVNGK